MSINSVTKQTCADWELIVVNDASDDETQSFLGRLKDERIEVIHLKECKERSNARNQGLVAAQGEWILFLDDDDCLPEDALDRHLSAFEKYKNSVCSIGSYTSFDPSSKQRVDRIVTKPFSHNIVWDIFFGWTAAPGQCMFRTQAVKKIGGWNPNVIVEEERELLLRLLKGDGLVALMPEVVLFKRSRNGGLCDHKRDEFLRGQICREAMKRLTGRDQILAGKILKARQHYFCANEHYEHHKFGEALRLYIRALGEAPELIRLPLSRKPLLSAIVKSCLGNLGIDL